MHGVPLGSSDTNNVLGNGGYSVESNDEHMAAPVNEDGEIAITGRPALEDFTAVVTVSRISPV